MTKGISDMLNLPHLDDVLKDDGVDYKDDEAGEDEGSVPVQKADVDILQSLQEKLQNLEGSDHAKAMDEIYRETLQHSRDIMDLAFNVDDRSRRGLMEIGVSMYKNAIDAKNSKRDAQLKAMKLMLDQQRQALDERKFRNETGESTTLDTDASIVEDRNVLVQRLRDQMKAEKEAEKEADKK